MPEWSKILAVHVTDKELILRICKELLQINKKKAPSRKMVKSFQQVLQKKEDVQTASGHMKRCSVCHQSSEKHKIKP